MPIPIRIKGFNREIGKPADWTPEHCSCYTLCVRDTIVNGAMFMMSAHELTSEELAALNAGAPLILAISGNVHPVMFMLVGDLAIQGLD